MINITKFQIGKFGVTSGVIESLELALKNHKQIRISVLKASGRDRNNIEQMAKDIIAGLDVKKEKCDYKIIGFTIILIKKGSGSPKQKSKPKSKK